MNPIQNYAWKEENHFLIVGGGIAGLASAIGVRKSGFPVTVLEQMPEIKEVSSKNFSPSLQADTDLWLIDWRGDSAPSKFDSSFEAMGTSRQRFTAKHTAFRHFRPLVSRWFHFIHSKSVAILFR